MKDQNPFHRFEGDALAAQPIMFAGRLWYLQLVSPPDHVGQIGNEVKYYGRGWCHDGRAFEAEKH
jgi:hypothetical protein